MSELADVKLPGDDAEDGLVDPKPCPFCGEEVIDKGYDIEGSAPDECFVFFCFCTNCGASGPDTKNLEDTISAWNGRVV
jgi:Lar family restriction alleviation protein